MSIISIYQKNILDILADPSANKRIKKHIMIIGDYKTGKSTFIKKFAEFNQLDYILDGYNFFTILYKDDGFKYQDKNLGNDK